MKKNHKKTGFTLIEVLIALSIIAIALLAFIKISTQESQHLAHLENKTIAQWIAEDIAAQLHVGLIPLPTPLDTLSGEQLVFDHHWVWSATFTATADKTALRTEITVRLKDENSNLSDYVTTLTP